MKLFLQIAAAGLAAHTLFAACSGGDGSADVAVAAAGSAGQAGATQDADAPVPSKPRYRTATAKCGPMQWEPAASSVGTWAQFPGATPGQLSMARAYSCTDPSAQGPVPYGTGAKRCFAVDPEFGGEYVWTGCIFGLNSEVTFVVPEMEEMK